MATLNGAEFKIIEAEWSTYQNNVIQEILGSDTVEVQNQGHGSDPVRIQGMVNNEKEMDDFQEQFYSDGVLTLIKDPESGRQYQVYALGNVRRENITNSLSDQGIIFTCMMQLRYPYSESVDTVTRSKSITTQNQEWSADDSSIDIKTEGNVDAVPDIMVTSGIIPLGVITEYPTISTEPSGMAWDGTYIWSCDNNLDKYYKHNADMTVHTTYSAININPSGMAWDGSNMWSCDRNSNKYYKHNGDMTLNTEYSSIDTDPHGMAWDGAYIWSCDSNLNKIYKHNADMTVHTTYSAPGTNPTGLTWDGSNMWSCDSSAAKIYKHNADMTVKSTYSAPNDYPEGLTWDGTNLWCCDSLSDKYYKLRADDVKIIDVIIYNTSDSTVKCYVTNEMLSGAIHRIDIDGTGTIDYDDNFTSEKWNADSVFLGVTQDTTNDELDIADDGYIYWVIDTKLPINGIPTLTSRINVTSGTPTIQISSNGSTWYDIDTAIIDDVETEYPLDSDGNLSLAGKTLFYFRYDCVKAAAATCSIKYFELDVAIHTIYVKNPKITKGSSSSTFRIDQDSGSGMACTVDLIFKNRWWV